MGTRYPFVILSLQSPSSQAGPAGGFIFIQILFLATGDMAEGETQRKHRCPLMLISGPEKRCRGVGISAVSATLMPIGSTAMARPHPDQLNQNAHGWDQPAVFFRTPHRVPVYTQVENHELMEGDRLSKKRL